MNLTNISGNHTQFYIFGNKNKTPIPIPSTKTKNCFDKLPFPLHLLVRLLQKNGPVLMPSKKSVKVTFVTFAIEKMRKSVDDLLVFSLIYVFWF